MKITPVFKANDIQDLNSYRSISILPFLSKILGKVVFKGTMDFVTKSSILYDKQFVFRQKHSTDMALFETVDPISEAMDNTKLLLEYLSTYPGLSILLITKSYCKHYRIMA